MPLFNKKLPFRCLILIALLTHAPALTAQLPQAIEVSDSRRFLQTRDGAPFLWIGDTAWQFMPLSSYEEWKAYIDDRRDKGFSVIQARLTPFEGLPNFSWRYSLKKIASLSVGDDYVDWKDTVQKIEYANEKGLIVFITGLSVLGSGPETAKLILQNLSGLNVILSPSMDESYSPTNNVLLQHLHKFRNRPLLTLHPNNKCSTPEKNLAQAGMFMDFLGIQSGHGGVNSLKAVSAAVACSLKLHKLVNSRMPLLNLEAIYDGRGTELGTQGAEDARMTAWHSWLSGSLGITYGAGSRRVDWERCIWCYGDLWEEALSFESADQIRFLSTFFKNIDWWKLIPQHDRVYNQSADPQQYVSVSVSQDNDFLVAYTNKAPAVEIDLSGLLQLPHLYEFDPRYGLVSRAEENLEPNKRLLLRFDHLKDRVILLSRHKVDLSKFDSTPN